MHHREPKESAVSNSQPPKSTDLIVMTRLNTVGLKRLAEGALVEKKPFESKPPAAPRLSEPPRVFTPHPSRLSEPVRVPPPPPAPAFADSAMHAAIAPMTTLEEEDQIEGADGAEDRTIALGADAAEDRTVAVPLHTPVPPAIPPSDHRLDIETPTTLFVKDIQRTLQEELQKQDACRAERMDAPTLSPPKRAPAESMSEDTVVDASANANANANAKTKAKASARVEPTFDLKFEPTPTKAPSVPAPPTSKPSSLAPPAKTSTPSLPAPLHAQASRRKDPIAVSVTTRPPRVERKGGFLPWAAALTALGVFVGVAGARVATGAPFLRAAAAPAPAPMSAPLAAPEPGFAPRVAVPAEHVVEAKPVEFVAKPADPVAPAVEVNAEEAVAANAEPAPQAAPPAHAVATAAKSEEKAETKEAKRPEPRADRPRPRHATPPVEKTDRPEKADKPEKSDKTADPPVAAKPSRPEKSDAPPMPPKGTRSPDVAAAARDYAAVQSQLGESL
jgi:hypothetical protein